MIIELPIPDRNPGMYAADRVCPVCAAVLSRNNPGPRCRPCQLAAMPECEVIELHPEDAA